MIRLRGFLIILIAAVMVLSWESRLLAVTLSSEDIKAIYNDTVFFDEISDTCTDLGFGPDDGSVTKINVSGSSNGEKVFNQLRTKGLTAVQAAAVLGNLYAESHLDPTMKQGFTHFSTAEEVLNSKAGFGLAQWTKKSRKLAWVDYTDSRGLDIIDLGAQVDWLWYEWQSNSSYGFSTFQNAGEDLRQATWIFVSYYEGPASVTGHRFTTEQPTGGPALNSLNERYKYAKVFLGQFGGNVVLDAATSDQCVSGVDSSYTDFSASGVRVDNSPSGLWSENCSSGLTDGASVLKQYILRVWSPPVSGIGDYFCRPINNCSNDERDSRGFCINNKVSIHGVGRALDIHLNANDPEELAVGNQIRNWLINNSTTIGVQRVIWDYHIWSSNKDGWRVYTGSNHHTDHIHVEINEDGANMILPWYSGRSL